MKFEILAVLTVTVVSMNLGQLLHQCDPGLKALFRKYERTRLKVVRNSQKIVFNQTCIKEGLLPNYTNIYICS